MKESETESDAIAEIEFNSNATSNKTHSIAESALIQANLIDRTHTEVWTRLVIVSLESNRTDLAHHALLQSIKLNSQCADLYRRIGNLYRQRGFLALSESTLQRSLSLNDNPYARLDLAEVYLHQHKLELAQQTLQLAGSQSLKLNDQPLQHTIIQRWNSLMTFLGRIEAVKHVDKAESEEKETGSESESSIQPNEAGAISSTQLPAVSNAAC